MKNKQAPVLNLENCKIYFRDGYLKTDFEESCYKWDWTANEIRQLIEFVMQNSFLRFDKKKSCG